MSTRIWVPWQDEPDAVLLSYMKGRATGTWVTHKIQQVLSPSEMPMMMDEFEAEVNLMFADPNKEATVQQKLSSLWQGISSVDELIQQFKIHGPKSRLGDIGLVHHFEQALNSCFFLGVSLLSRVPCIRCDSVGHLQWERCLLSNWGTLLTGCRSKNPLVHC